MDRRKFVLGAAASTFASLGRAVARPPSAGSDVAVKLMTPGNDWPVVVPADFIGLSYEMGQL